MFIMVVQSRRRDLLAGFGVAGGMALAGCVDAISGQQRTEQDYGGLDRTVNLGIVQPLSGDLEGPGTAIKQAALLPVSQVEDAVDLSISVEIVDSETREEPAVRGIFDLVQKGYEMFNGPAASEITLQATQQVTIPHRAVVCSPASTSPTITTLNDAGLVFRTAVSDAFQSRALAQQAVDDLDASTASVMYVDDDYGWQLTQSFSRAFETEHGGSVVGTVSFHDEQDSYADDVATATADAPDVLVLIAFPETGARILNAFYEAGGEQDVLVTDGLRSPDLYDTVDHPVDAISGTAPLPVGPGYAFFEAEFEAAYEQPPGVFTAEAYDATAVLLLANAYAGRNDGEAIRNAMRTVTQSPGEVIEPENLTEGLIRAAAGESIEYRGASGVVEFDTNGDQQEATYEYFTFDEAGWQADGTPFETLAEVTV